jgi:hypothetical protein
MGRKQVYMSEEFHGFLRHDFENLSGIFAFLGMVSCLNREII